jgi:hypothetical protein
VDDEFKQLAREHQEWFRKKILGLHSGQGSMLAKKDAWEGRNFYHGYDVFEVLKKDPRFRRYRTPLYANMLRSEHIPFNFFVPFDTERELLRSTLVAAFEVNPAKILSIQIEHAPIPAEDYLNDKTSFDVFCEYEESGGSKVFIAIEVKYTEHGYTAGKKEKDGYSEYLKKSKEYGLYRTEVLESGALRRNRFRQMWRNHLLAECLFQHREFKYREYKSVVLYPSWNKYVSKAAADYRKLLTADRANSFLAVSFIDFFDAIKAYSLSQPARDWVAYLRERYIPEMHPSF